MSGAPPPALAELAAHARQYARDAVEHLALACLAYATLCALLYILIARVGAVRFGRGPSGPRRVLLVVAHPDDECMFFGPLLYDLANNKNLTLYIICMSIGDFDGLGKRRKKELYEACEVLGISEGCITVYNHTLMPDDPKANWPTELLSELILRQVEMYDIDTLITFDKHGVSGHPNHRSIYYSIAHLSLDKRLPSGCKVYVLETVNLLRKYWFVLDIPLSFLLSRYRYILRSEGRTLVRKAMGRHQSQLVWYRRLYMLFSRYVVINTLQQMDLSDIELDLVDD